MKRPLITIITAFAIAVVLAGCAAKTVWVPLYTAAPAGSTPALTPGPSASADASASAGSDELFANDVDSMKTPKIIIYKARHVLEVWDGDTLMARMSIATGKAEGAKSKEGDNKTPEGKYYICKTSDKGKFYKSLFLSYPNADDAQAGLDAGIISQSQYDSITQSIENREQPAWDTPLGGEIAINGTGTGGAGKSGDWTVGNIALSDSDMDYLFKYITDDADVEINP